MRNYGRNRFASLWYDMSSDGERYAQLDEFFEIVQPKVLNIPYSRRLMLRLREFTREIKINPEQFVKDDFKQLFKTRNFADGDIICINGERYVLYAGEGQHPHLVKCQEGE